METPEYLNDCAECVVRAEEIKADRALMKELEPYLEEKMKRIKKVLSLDEIRKLASEKSLEEQDEEEKSKEKKLEKVKEKEEDEDDDMPEEEDEYRLGAKA
jgi:hypothetical protein